MEALEWIDGAGGLWPRADDDMLGDGQVTGNFRFQSNSTTAIINQFRFQAAKSIRTSTIILASFNVVAAFATAVGIFWDSYLTAKRNNPKFKFRSTGFTFIGAAETFPLILATGIVIQGITFAVAQSTGLEHLLVLGCTLTSQLMLPAVFIVPYIQLIFGLEVTMRACARRRPFPVRGKWNVTICLAIIGTLLLITFLVTHFIRPPNFCFASLFWFVQRYKEGCFALFMAITTVLTACTIVIFLKLHNYSKIDSTERVAASRMVYYLAVAIISNALMVPFFFALTFQDQMVDNSSALNLSMVSAVVANVSGLLTGGLHLFLRSNTLSTIRPRDKYEAERQKLKRGIRVWGPASGGSNSFNSTTNYGSHIMRPVGVPRPIQRTDSAETLIPQKEEEAALESPRGSPTYERVNPLRSNAVFPATATAGAPAATTQEPELTPPQTAKTHLRKESYSLFPNRNTASTKTASTTLLPATTYSPPSSKKDEPLASADTLKPPPSVHTNGRHRRDSSMASSATVQIGLRLSNVEDMPPLDSRYFQDRNKVYSLDCPNANKGESAPTRPSPLSQMVVEGEENREGLAADAAKRDPVKAAKMKTLPPIPMPTQQAQSSNDGPTLNPTVYSPRSPTMTKVTSPRGVGFGSPSGSPGPSSGSRSPPTSPPRSTPPRDCSKVAKGEWI